MSQSLEAAVKEEVQKREEEEEEEPEEVVEEEDGEEVDEAERRLREIKAEARRQYFEKRMIIN